MKKTVLMIGLLITAATSKDITLDDIKSTATEIDSSLGQINGIIDQISGFNLQEVLQGVTEDNELLGCLTQNIDLGDVAGSLPNVDGICGLVSSAGSGGFALTDILDNPIAKCAGVKVEKPKEIQKMQERLQAFCSGSTPSGNNSVDNGGGWDSSTGNNGGTGGKPPKDYSPVSVVAAGIEVEGANGGVQTSAGGKDLEEKTFPSGIKVKDLYSGDNGGMLYKSLSENPDGSDAMAIKTNNTHTLILKEMALKVNGTTNEDTVHLPKDKLAVIQSENDVANIVALGEVDINDLKNSLVVSAREKFKEIEAPSLSEYYIKEKNAYQEMIGSGDVAKMIALIKEKAILAIGNRYEMELMKLKEDPNYIFNPSYTTERITKKEYRDKFKAMSLLQMNKETAIKADMAREKRQTMMRIDKAVQDAYYLASIFRADIAKKEIDEMLKAVDTTIH